MIFVDASFWIALRLPRDDRHATARTLFEENANGPLSPGVRYSTG